MSISGIQDLFLFGIHVNGGASLMGFGTLRITRIPASYTTDKRTILPPQSDIIFEDVFQQAFDLSAIAEKLSLPREIFEIWTANFFNQFDSKNAVEPISADINGLGNIEKTGNKFYFNASDQWINIQPYRNFLSFPVKSLPVNKDNISFVVENPKALVFEGKKTKPSHKNWFLPIFIIGTVALFMIIKECSVSKTAPNQKNIVAEKQTDAEVYNENTETVKELTKATDTSDKVQITETLPNQEPIVEKSGTNVQSGNTEKSNVSENISKNSAEIKQNAPCIYVVGAFKVKKNALKLIKNLKKQGFKAQITGYGDFYRVGILSECFTDTSGQYAAILKKYPDVWLLEE